RCLAWRTITHLVADPRKTRITRKWKDAADPAEVVVHVVVAKLIAGERVLREQLELRDVVGRHHRAAADADRAVAAHPAGDRRAREPEADAAAVAAALVGGGRGHRRRCRSSARGRPPS